MAGIDNLKTPTSEQAREYGRKGGIASERLNKRVYDTEALERLERVQALERLEITNGSYKDYKHKTGDVVYCDPPYEGTAKYEKGGFDHDEFYDWVATRAYPVFFSSYEITDNRFKLVFAKRRRGSLSAVNNNDYQWERLYTNSH